MNINLLSNNSKHKELREKEKAEKNRHKDIIKLTNPSKEESKEKSRDNLPKETLFKKIRDFLFLKKKKSISKNLFENASKLKSISGNVQINSSPLKKESGKIEERNENFNNDDGRIREEVLKIIEKELEKDEKKDRKDKVEKRNVLFQESDSSLQKQKATPSFYDKNSPIIDELPIPQDKKENIKNNIFAQSSDLKPENQKSKEKKKENVNEKEEHKTKKIDDDILIKNNKQVAKKEEKKIFQRIKNLFFKGKKAVQDEFGSDKEKQVNDIQEISRKMANSKRYKRKGKKIREDANSELKLNFISEEFSGALRVKLLEKTILFLVTLLFVFATIFVIRLFIDWYKNKLIQEQYLLISKAKNLNIELQEYQKYGEGAENLQNKIEKIEKLIDSHIKWSIFFNFLENNTIPEVYYKDFGGDKNGIISLNAKAMTYTDAAKQLKIFRSLPEIEEVLIFTISQESSGDQLEVDGVSFGLSLKMKKNFLK